MVVDPGFPRGGVNSKGACKKLSLGQFLPGKYMTMKEIGLKGGAMSVVPPWISQCYITYCSFVAHIMCDVIFGTL